MGAPLTSYDAVGDQLYDWQLTARYRSPWVYSPSLAFLKDADLWTTILADADVRAIRQRRNQNLVRQWHVSANEHISQGAGSKAELDASKRKAGICHEALSFIDDFDMARFVLADSFFLGRRYQQIRYEERTLSLDGTPEMNWFVPVELKDVDRRRFRWIPKWSKSNKLESVALSMFELGTGEWIELTGDKRMQFVEDVWENTEDRLGRGLPALECLFFTHYFKTGTLRKIVEFVDRLAGGILVGNLKSTRAASTDLPNSTVQSTTLDRLKKIRTEHVVALGDDDKLEVLEASGAGAQIMMEVVRYFVESAERLCNGAVGQAGHSTGKSGGTESKDVESETAESYYQFPRDHMDGVYNRDLLGSFLYFNEANFERLGLGNAKRPRFSSQQVKRQDPMERIETLNQFKAPIPTTHYYEAGQVPMPEDGEPVIEPTPDPSMMDAEIDEETGLPKTSKDARKHEEKMAKQKAKKPAAGAKK